MTIPSPDSRSLMTTLVTPPPGMVLDEALATTYTLDPLTLLTIPLHLAWLASGNDKSLLGDGIRLYEALRRVGERLTVYADRGRMQAPGQAHPLYCLLESMIVEVRAPGGGAFHPKLWVLRFVEPDGGKPPCIRLGILSRNITGDRSWDLSLMLEGQPTGRYVAANRQIGELIRDLPTYAVGAVTEARRESAERLADEVRRTNWELPSGCNEVSFHVLGRTRRAWAPPRSSQLAVISPFLTDGAINALCGSTNRPVALVSRPDQLAMLSPATRSRFERCLILDEAAETEDGEDTSSQDTLGLHAKALVMRSGWDTRLFVGSVNASAAAMLQGANIEVWAELVGKTSKLGGIDELLSSDGLGAVLADFDEKTSVPSISEEQAATEAALDQARSAVVAAELSLRCVESAGAWQLVLQPGRCVDLGDVTLSAWPLSVRSETAVSADAVSEGHDVSLGTWDAADITGMVGFVLKKNGQEVRFALNLPLLGLPAERDGALARRILQNRDGFLRYLLLLLGDFEGGEGSINAGAGIGGQWKQNGDAMPALLEEMVRAFARDRARLANVRRTVERLLSSEGSEEIVPADFLAVWEVFDKAMEVTP